MRQQSKSILISLMALFVPGTIMVLVDHIIAILLATAYYLLLTLWYAKSVGGWVAVIIIAGLAILYLMAGSAV